MCLFFFGLYAFSVMFKKPLLSEGIKMAEEQKVELTFPHKNMKNTSTSGTVHTEHLLNAGRRPQTSKKVRKHPDNWLGQKEKEKERNRHRACSRGESSEGGKVPTPWEVPSPVGRSTWMEGNIRA